MFGVLKEQHADHIVLSDSSRIALAAGLILEPFGLGARITITYSRDGDDAMVAQSVKTSAIPRVSDRA